MDHMPMIFFRIHWQVMLGHATNVILLFQYIYAFILSELSETQTQRININKESISTDKKIIDTYQ